MPLRRTCSALAAVILGSNSFAVGLPPIDEGVGESIELVTGQSRMVDVDGRIKKVVVVDPSIADAQPVESNAVLLLGLAPGTTDVVFQLEDGESVWRRLTVGLDEERLAGQLSRLFGVALRVDEVDGTVAIRGEVPDLATAENVRAYMDRTALPWVDLTRLPGLQQVQLRVRIAEASRSALRELAFGGVSGGSDFFAGVQAPTAGAPFQPVGISPGSGAPVADAGFRFDDAAVSSATTLFAGVPGANLEIYLQALDENRYVRLLAEPNLVAVSGEEATFLVGGEFPIPVPQSSNGGGITITVEYKEFGVRLVFRPEVLGDGRIRLEVAPEVSELSQTGALNLSGYTVPGVITRRSSTTVELGSGQTFAMAGLLRTTDEARVTKVPLLGEIPILGTLFRSVRYEEEQTELLVMVTAEVVEPLDDGMDRPMPGDLHTAPNDWELFVGGRYEGSTGIGDPMARLDALGLSGLQGPGAWRTADDPRVPAADPMPEFGDGVSDGTDGTEEVD
jgi:pilus assembly protein CpaC